MIRRRRSPDGLPFRVYERTGARTYSIGYKAADGRWLFRLSCPVGDVAQREQLRREAITRSMQVQHAPPAEGTFAALAAEWLQWQESLPAGSPGKRAASTLTENRSEIKALNKAFGGLRVAEMRRADGYTYLDACLVARHPKTNAPRPRPAKGNKEISLASLILEFGVRRQWLEANPFSGIEKIRTTPPARYVSDQELGLALEVGRRMGGPYQIVALALRVAYLCVRRSVEVRGLTRDQIRDDGIVWTAAKRQAGQAARIGLIEWSPELRAAVDEALSVKRHEVAGSWYVFGSMRGQRYTKGGWKATLSKLMAECVAEAGRRRLAFAPFSLQDCRPKGVSDKMARGDADVIDATLHTSDRMVRQVYDRRTTRRAKPAA